MAAAKTVLDKAHLAIKDEYFDLDSWYGREQVKKKTERRAALSKAIQSWYQDQPAEEPIRAEASRCYLDLSPAKNERRIASLSQAFAALKRKLGLSNLIESLTLHFKLLDVHLTEEEQAAFVVEERTGPRTISVVPK